MKKWEQEGPKGQSENDIGSGCWVVCKVLTARSCAVCLCVRVCVVLSLPSSSGLQRIPPVQRKGGGDRTEGAGRSRAQLAGTLIIPSRRGYKRIHYEPGRNFVDLNHERRKLSKGLRSQSSEQTKFVPSTGRTAFKVHSLFLGRA